jgi:hypothetical protein
LCKKIQNKGHGHRRTFIQEKVSQKTAEQRQSIIHHACPGRTKDDNGRVPQDKGTQGGKINKGVEERDPEKRGEAKIYPAKTDCVFKFSPISPIFQIDRFSGMPGVPLRSPTGFIGNPLCKPGDGTFQYIIVISDKDRPGKGRTHPHPEFARGDIPDKIHAGGIPKSDRVTGRQESAGPVAAEITRDGE